MKLRQGHALVKLARDSISAHLDNKELSITDEIKKEFSEKQGVFVTLTINKELRGCIGFPEPTLQLWEAVSDAARSAAFEDPRFTGLTKDEYKQISVEMSVLTVPKLIEVKEPEEYVNKIKVGRDGLIVELGLNKGLLLPQVAVELSWNCEEFLDNTCEKAGLAPGCWKEKQCKVYSFQAQIFSEENGTIVEK